MQTIVIGYLNTDLIATGIKQFPKPGEHVYGKELIIGPGGKSRNIADMIARLSPAGSVAMVSRTVRDPYGFWKVPIDALHDAGVNTDYVNILSYGEAEKLPGIALIPVDQRGNNQIFVLPGISNDFNTKDIDRSVSLFKEVGRNGGVLVLTLECPLPTALHAVKIANNYGLKVIFDPGGIEPDSDLAELIKSGVYLIKPNEHEAKILTGIDVVDYKTAEHAANVLRKKGIANILITTGVNGAYLFGEDVQKHIPIPKLDIKGTEKDETGCGDQAMAAVCAFMQQGKTIQEAAELAVLAGTIQFHRTGVRPIELSDLDMAE